MEPPLRAPQRSARVTSIVVGLAAVLWVSQPSVAPAGVNLWTGTGPSDGDIRSLVMDPVNPNTVYVGTSGPHVFKTTDAGGKWIAASDGLTADLPVYALVLDPSNRMTLYAATRGVFKTSNGGIGWSAINSGFPVNVSVFSLAMDPTTSNTLYAGTDSGLFKTVDAGTSWRAVNIIPSDSKSVTAIVIDPTSPHTLYVGKRGVFKSTDAGTTWSDLSAAFPDAVSVQKLAIDPADSNTLFAGTFGKGMFKSSDGGATWNDITAQGGALSDGVAIHNYVNTFAFDPLSPDTVYVGTGVSGFGGGAFKSSDGGASWTAFDAGLPNTAVNVLAVDPRTRPLYAGTGSGPPQGVMAFTAPLTACPATPQSACQSAASQKASVMLKTVGGNSKLDWKWTGSAATAKADFGAPLTATDYMVCVYDGTGFARKSALEARAIAPAGVGWRQSNFGFTYTNRALDQSGIAALTLKAGAAGKGKISITAKGPNFDLSSLPLSGPVTVQLIRSDSPQCWEATYSTTLTNTATQFRAKSTTSTFQRIQAEVFDVSCSSQTCHTRVGRAGDMVLEPGYAYKSLVGQPPSNPVAKQHGYLRVAPGRPDTSFILAKLTDALASGEGVSMPYSAALLTDQAVGVIRSWIIAGAPTDGVVPGDDGAPLGGGGEDAGDVSLPPPANGVQLKATAPAIPQGTEETACHYLKLQADAEFDVNRIQVAVSGGSHHIHLYRAFNRSLNIPDHFEVCNQAVDFDTWELVVAVQLRRTDWELPPGVAFHFRPGEQLLIQTHFVNVGSLETIGEGKAVMNLNAAEPGTVTAHAGTIFGQNKDVFVPAHSNTTQDAECVFPKALNLMGETGHYHFRGRRFDTWRWDDGVRGELTYENDGYSDPKFLIHDPPLPFDAGQGLQWECYWENNTSMDFKFGPFTDINEHCNWFGFYYPTDSLNESMTCVKKSGVAKTTVRAGQ